MPEAGPSGGDASYDDALDRVADLLRANREQLLEIERASEASFRKWLDSLVQEISEALGIAAAKIRAFVDDMWAVVGRAKDTFGRSYKESYGKARQIRRK